MADFYQTSFTVKGSKEDPSLSGIELMEKVDDSIVDWIENRFGESLGDAHSKYLETEDGDAVQLDRGQNDLSGFLRIVLEHTGRDDDDVSRWRTDIRLATEGESVEFDVDVRKTDDEDRPLELGTEVNVSPPLVLKSLLEQFDCCFGEDLLMPEAERITLKEAARFAENVVFAMNRRIPLVILTENPYGGVFVGANYLQSYLLGIAKVVTYDGETAKIVNDSLGDQLQCSDGTIRVFIPGCSHDDPLWQNVFWTWKRMNFIEWDQFLFEVSRECFSHFLPQVGSRLYDEVSVRVHRSRQEQLLKRIRSMESSVEDVTTYEELLDEAAGTLNELGYYKREIAELRKQLAERDAVIEQLNVSLRHQSADPRDADESSVSPEFDTLYQAVEYCQRNMDGRLRFFSRAVELAKGADFQRPNEVYEIFESLVECGDARISGSLGMDIQGWLSQKGVDYSPHESDTTMGKYGKDRTFYDNESRRHVEMQEHIKLSGKRLRIHVYWSEDEHKWLIGYIGRHLRTASG